MRLTAALALLLSHACEPASPAAPGSIAAPPPAAAAPQPPSPAPPAAPVAAVAEAPVTEESGGCRCPSEASAGADEEAPADDATDAIDDEDPDARTRRSRQRKTVARALAARVWAALPEHRPACDVVLSGPCSVRADLDGDGVGDDAVLVRSKNGAGGIAILWGKGGVELLGGGRRGQCWTTTEVPDSDGTVDATPCPEEIDADLSWVARWELRSREVRGSGPVFVGRVLKKIHEFPAPGAVGDGLLVDGGDAAAILYRRADGWTLMHLGY